MNGAQATVESLSREGVTHVFGLPGTTIMDLIDALGEQRQTLRYIAVRHESTASFMADGFARASGRVAACMASRGPGAANLSIGVHNAHAEAVPMIVLMGQIPDAYTQRDAFEEMDLTAFFAPMTKWQTEVHLVERIPEQVQRACRLSMAGRRGPVLVSVPMDVQTTQAPDALELQPRWRPAEVVPDQETIVAMAELLAGSSRPMIILGGGAPEDGGSVIELAELLGAPVTTTFLRKSKVPNSSPVFLGALGYGAVEVSNSAVREADVILALGMKMGEFTTNRWTLIPPEAKLIHVDIDELVLGRVTIPTIGIAADAGRTVGLLTQALRDRKAGVDSGDNGRGERLADLRRRYLEQTELPEVEPGRPGVSSQALLRALQGIVDEPDTALVIDAPGFSTWVQRYMSFERPDSFYGCSGGSMGWGLPAAMGIKLARPRCRTIMVAGDGSFWMVAQDLETAVREQIPVIVVVANNFAFGNTRDRQRFAYGERYNGVFYGNPDFAKYAELLGAYGERVEHDSEVDAAIRRALDSGRPAVIDVIQDRMEGLPPDIAPPGITRS